MPFEIPIAVGQDPENESLFIAVPGATLRFDRSYAGFLAIAMAEYVTETGERDFIADLYASPADV